MSSGGESLSYFPLSFKEALHLGIKQGWPVNVKNCVVVCLTRELCHMYDKYQRNGFSKNVAVTDNDLPG